MYNRPFDDKKSTELPSGDRRRASTDRRREENIPVFAPVADLDAQTKTHVSAFLEINAGAKLIEQWKKCDNVSLIRSGVVKLVCTIDNGSQVSLGLRSTGWYAGAASVLLGISDFYSVVAVTDCTVTQIPARELFAYATKNVKKLNQFMKSLCLDSILQAKLHAEISASSVAERLDHLMEERAAIDPQWQRMDPLPLLKQGELAQLLSCTPEHLSRLRNQRMHDKDPEVV
jgi:CRP-like cAMP-binding protein